LGALTLKSYPFEIRRWDIESFESIDPTDGFGSTTRVYISKNQVFQIEPDHTQINNTWITDKGRQFFDGIFSVVVKTPDSKSILEKKSVSNFLNKLIKTIYIFDICSYLKTKNYYLTIVVEDVSLEIMSLLNILEQNYSFVKIRKADNSKINNNLESYFQINLSMNPKKLKDSNLCLLLSTNSRYEGFSLNIKLRQRFLKGNFKCLVLGPLIDLTFPTTFLGSNFKVFKSICEGNHLICQDIRFSNNPIIALNNNFFKRSDAKNFENLLKMFNYSKLLNKNWYSYNILNPSLYDTGNIASANLKGFTNKDFLSFSTFYLFNVPENSLGIFKKIIKSKILNYYFESFQTNLNQLFVEQSPIGKKSSEISILTKTDKYVYLPVSMFYENGETFFNTIGSIKKTNKLIFRKKTKNSWQILRRILNLLKKNIIFLMNKDNQTIFFKSKKISDFRNFMNFQYYATKSLTSLNYFLNNQNKPFALYKSKNTYKNHTFKFYNSKVKYWLDDFFHGGKDTYSHNSLILANSSKILRTESTNFF